MGTLKYAIPILASLNAEETIDFYTKKLGFTHHANWDGYLIFERDKVEIHHWPTSDPEVPKSTGCYVHVTDVQELYGQLKAEGVVHPNGELKVMPWKMKQFSILDNSGNIIHFGQQM